MTTRELTYVFDAYCGWSYGFGPALRTFLDGQVGNVEVRLLSGGLFTGDRVVPIRTFEYVRTGNAQIHELTGAVFGSAYQQLVDEGSFLMDSHDAAVGFVSLRTAAPTRALELALAMQDAFYRDGLSLSDPETYRSIAELHGLDAARVLDLLTDPTTTHAARTDFAEARSLGVTSYPTLLLHTQTGVAPIGRATSSAVELTASFERLNRSVAATQ